jgi:hypothetical protein
LKIREKRADFVTKEGVARKRFFWGFDGILLEVIGAYRK